MSTTSRSDLRWNNGRKGKYNYQRNGRVIGVDLNGSEVTNRLFNAVPSIVSRVTVDKVVVLVQNILNDDGSIAKVQVLKPGTNFPPAPDGSVGETVELIVLVTLYHQNQ